ncbi:MAG: radical SAM family heme chaperone HemW [Ruminococcaceae bacterium]|nr:radical SAM family heme chaperone HemW [Oscillospiraceae bacterium]
MTNLGLYVHVPFCEKKCNYCDFYSFSPNGEMLDLYTNKVQDEIKRWGVRAARPIDSLYLGGGTPSLLGGERIEGIVKTAKEAFMAAEDTEITLECNPADDLADTLKSAASAGVNRISLGVQTANEKILEKLGRRHRNSDVIKTVADARAAGIDNISLDLMIGLPESDMGDVANSLDFLLSLNPSHISVYILKIEEGTVFGKNPPLLPDDDKVSEQYLFAARYLKENGFSHYEISNFAKEGKMSRHNLKYWNCEEYIGIGPAAHSFLNGKRFFYERDINKFLGGMSPISDGEGGDREEYLMLRLRLSEGIKYNEFEKRFGRFPYDWKKTAERLSGYGLVNLDNNGFALTEEGFLVSNKVLGEFI